MDSVLLSAHDSDFGQFKEISFSSPQTLFDFDLVLWDLRWLCYSYRFARLEEFGNWSEPKRLMFYNGYKQKILHDRERRISEIEHLLDFGGALVIIVSIPIIFSFAEDGDEIKKDSQEIIDNYSFLPHDIELQIREKLVEGSGSKIEFRGDKALLPAWKKIKNIAQYSCYFSSDFGNPFLYIKNTNYPVGSWFSYRNGYVLLIPHTPDDGSDDYPAFMNAAMDLVGIVRTLSSKNQINNPSYLGKEEVKLIPESAQIKEISNNQSSPIEQEIYFPLCKNLTGEEKTILESLYKVSPSLAYSYAQVKIDLKNDNRYSWAGTAHEIREVLVTTLRTLAPDLMVEDQSWYKKEPNTSGPTQKQRVKYILQQYDVSSKELEVVNQVTHLEEMIEDLVRAFYSRASDAAHQRKEKREVERIVNYFDAFAHDLLNLD